MNNEFPINYFGNAREHAEIKDQLMDVVESVILSGQSLQGPSVNELEVRVRNMVGRDYAVAVGSCTDALYFSLLASGIAPGDQVIVPAFTFLASASCILRANAVPVFADVNENGNLLPDSVAKLVNHNTKAVVYVHMFGYYDYENFKKVSEICSSKGILLIEDAAQAFGAGFAKKIAGAGGVVSCFSFDPTKVIAAPGSGGMMLTNDESIDALCRGYRYHGKSQTGEFNLLGFNSQMPTMTAAILNLKLQFECKWKRRRIEIADHYINELSNLPIGLPPKSDGASHIYHKFVIKTKRRDELKAFMSQRGVQTMIHYERPLPLLPVFKSYGIFNEFNNALLMADEVLSLPCHPFLKKSEVEYISGCVRDFFSVA